MATTSQSHSNFLRRKTRTRAKLASNQATPRLTVFRSLRHIYAQIIDDQSGKTLVSSNDVVSKAKGTKTAQAEAVGTHLAGLAKEKKIAEVRFDRGAYKFHGRVAALAEAARKNGLKF